MIVFANANQIARANTLDECLAYVFLAALHREPLWFVDEKNISRIKADDRIIFMWHHKPSRISDAFTMEITYERAEELIRELWNDRIIPYGSTYDDAI